MDRSGIQKLAKVYHKTSIVDIGSNGYLYVDTVVSEVCAAAACQVLMFSNIPLATL